MSSPLSPNQADHSPRDYTLKSALLQLTDQPLVVVANSQVLAASAQALRLLNLPSEFDIRGQSVAVIFSTRDRAAVLRQLESVASGSAGAKITFDCDIARADQTQVAVRVAATQCLEGNRPVTLCCFVPRDDNGTHATQPEAPRERSYLKRSAVFGDIASTMVHELSQPVTVIHGAGELLRDVLDKNDVPEVARRAAAMIVDASMQLSVRFRYVWEFIRERRIELRRESLNAVVTDAVPLFDAVSHAGAGKVELRLGENLPDIVIDASLLRMLVVTLLTRCARASRTVTPLTVMTARSGPALVELRIESCLPASAAVLRETAANSFDIGEKEMPWLDVCGTIVAELGGVLRFSGAPNADVAGFCVTFPAAQ